MSFPGAFCYFCGKPPLGEYKARCATPAAAAALRGQQRETWTLLWLCQAHYTVLAAAGERGRVYRRSGHRWWLDEPGKLAG
jgi:hypothetical protein